MLQTILKYMETYYRLGFTIPQVDEILAPYAEKSYQLYLKDIMEDRGETEPSEYTINKATRKVRRDFEQGFQGWE